MTSHFKRLRVDAAAQPGPALRLVVTAVPSTTAVVAEPSATTHAPAPVPIVTTGSICFRVRFSSLGWAPDPATLSQQV